MVDIVGSIGVEVVPDVTNFRRDLAARLAGIRVDIGLNADVEALRAQLDEATRNRPVRIQVDVDTAAAQLRLDLLARDRTANVNVKESGLAGVAAGISGVTLAVAGLGPALIPVVGVVAGLAASLVAPLAVAGGGLTIGALIGGLAIKRTKEQIKEIGKLEAKVATAQTAVDAASTPEGKKSAQAELAAATEAYKTALDELSPSQLAFMDSQERLSGSFDQLVKAAGPAIFAPMVTGMDLLAGVLPKLAPLLTPISAAVVTLLDEVGAFTKGPNFKGFIASFGSASASAITTFGHIFGDFLLGIFNLFKAFTPLSGGFVKSLAGMAQGFADWSSALATNAGFQAFIGYVRKSAPLVASTFGNIFKAIGKIVIVLAPLGGLVLGLVDAFAGLIATASPDTLAVIAGGVGAIGLAIGIATGGFTLIVPAIVAIVAGLTYAYTHFTGFRDVVDEVAGKAVAAFQTVKEALSAAFSDSGPGGGISGVVATLKTFGGFLVTNFVPVVQAAATMFRMNILPAVVALGGYLAANLFPVFRQVGGIIKQLVPVIAGLALIIYGTVYPAVVTLVAAIGTQLKPVFDQIFASIREQILPAVSRLVAKFQEWMPTIKRIVVVVLLVVGALLFLAAKIIGFLVPIIIKFAAEYLAGLIDKFIATVEGIAKFIGAIIRIGAAVFNAGRKVVEFVRGLKDRFGDAVAFAKTIPGRIGRALGDLGGLLVDKGRDLISGFIEGIRGMGGKLVSFLKKFVTEHVPAPIAKALGMASPSKVMAEQAKYIPLGMIDGIDSQGGKVDRAMTRLSSRVQITAPRQDASMLATTGAGTGAAGRGGQEIHGTLGIDRDGVAYIRGIARDAVQTGKAAREAALRNEATGAVSFT